LTKRPDKIRFYRTFAKEPLSLKAAAWAKFWYKFSKNERDLYAQICLISLWNYKN
jgi:hypothetical protein